MTRVVRGRVSAIDRSLGRLIRLHPTRDRLASEAERMIVGEMASLASGVFRIPKILHVDPERCTLTLEFIESYSAVGIERRDLASTITLLERVGTALRIIHSYSYGEAMVPLYHGDVSLYNVGIDGSDQLVFVDWDPAPGLDGLGITAQEKDVAMLVWSIVADCVQRLRSRRSTRRLVDAMLSKYTGDTGDQLSKQRILVAADAVSRQLAQYPRVPEVVLPLRLYYLCVRKLVARTVRSLAWV